MTSTKKELTIFFVIAFGWMWLINLPRLMAAFGWLQIPALLSTLMGYLALFGPGIAAFILTGIRSGKGGVKTLWQSGWRINFEKRWLLPAILLVPAAGLITWLALVLLNVPIEWQYGAPPAMIVPIGLLIWLFNAYPEEYGWRGYALPRLLEKFSPAGASLILGALWGVWHLPLHFIPTTTQYAIPVWEFIAQIIVLTFLFTWLHIGTGGSVFIASLLHAFGNIAGAAIPYWTSSAGRWISFALLLIAAVLVTIFSPEMKNERREKPA